MSCLRLAVAVLGALMLGAGPVRQATPEVKSEVGDVGRERDAVFLRVDGRAVGEDGRAGRGAKEIVVRLDAMVRGRAWPGRWTVVEVEVRSGVSQGLTAGWRGGVARGVAIEANRWTAVRVVVDGPAREIVIGVPGGAREAIEFRKVRLVDDRWVMWSEGWELTRVAGVVTARRPALGAVELGEEWSVIEVGKLRALVSRKVEAGAEEVGAIYASGRATVADKGLVGEGQTGRVRVDVPEDMGRVDRGTAGDGDGDGYNERRAATMVRAVAGTRRMTLTVGAVAREGQDAVVSRPAIEISGLVPGRVTVLWEGKVVTSWDRVSGTEPPGVLIELPGEVRGESRVDVSVEQER